MTSTKYNDGLTALFEWVENATVERLYDVGYKAKKIMGSYKKSKQPELAK